MRVEVWVDGAKRAEHLAAYHQIGDDGKTRKQGYALPVMPSPSPSPSP